MEKQGFEIIKGGLTVLLAVFILFAVARAGIFSPPAEPGPTMRPLSDLPTATEIWDSAARTLTSFGNLVTDIVSGVWNKAVSGLTTDGSIGKLVVDNLDQPLSSTESNIRGADSDTLKALSDQIDSISGGGLDSSVWTNTKAGYLDVSVSSRSALFQSDILSDAAPFRGADIDAPISSRATQSDILSDATSFKGADISGILTNTSDIENILSGTDYVSGVSADASGNVLEQLEFIMQNLGGYTYGSSDASHVLTVANGTYDATYLTASNVRGDVNFGVGQVGTYVGSGNLAYGSDYSSKVLTTAEAAGTYDASSLSVGTVRSGVDFGVGLTGDYPSATYQLPGDTVADDATAAEIKSGFEVWTKTGSLLTGTMPIQILSDTSDTLSAGYYDATTLSAVDADLITGSIKSGITIFGIAGDTNVVDTSSGDAGTGDILTGKTAWVDGVSITGAAYGDSDPALVLGTATSAGTALVNLFAGSDTGGSFPGGSQAQGGVDDYNNDGTAASGRYEGSWTLCNAGNNYCSTGLASADAKDDSTGLIWSLPCDENGCASFSDASLKKYRWDNTSTGNAGKTAYQLCSEGAHGEIGWSLPHQKQLIQVYIDGSYGKLKATDITTSNNDYYWSATTKSWGTGQAWKVDLSHGRSDTSSKSDSKSYVRCVR